MHHAANNERSSSLAELGFLCAACILPLALYCFSLDPDVGFWDTGEMNTVPYILGLAHPTGFPTEVLLGWIASHVMPFGTVAMRLTLLNAVELSLASALAYAYARSASVSRPIALFCALAFACTPLVWRHATHTDVLSLTVLLLASVFVLMQRWHATGRDTFLYAAAACGGLAAGTHGAAWIYLLCPLVALALTRPRPAVRVAASAVGLAAAIACAVYLYLPLRSDAVVAARLDPTLSLGFGPGMGIWDWGDPRVPEKFAGVLAGAQAGAPSAAVTAFSPAHWPGEIRFAFDALARGVGIPSLAVLALVCAFAFIADRRTALLLASPAVVITPFVASFPAESDPARYYIFPLWGLAVVASIGLQEIVRRFGRSAQLRLAAGIAAAALLGAAIVGQRALFAQRGDTLARSYATSVIAATPNDAIVFAPWTYATPLAYAAYVDASAGGRTFVPAAAQWFPNDVARLLAQHAVYAIDERAPESTVFRAHFVRAFGVNPDRAHDPKLFLLTSAR